MIMTRRLSASAASVHAKEARPSSRTPSIIAAAIRSSLPSRDRSLIQHECPEPALLFCYNGLRALVPIHLLDRFDPSAVNILYACKARGAARKIRASLGFPSVVATARNFSSESPSVSSMLAPPPLARRNDPRLSRAWGDALAISKCHQLSRIAALCLAADFGKPPDLVGREPCPHQAVAIQRQGGAALRP